MPLSVCPRCHFRQPPAERCRRCGDALAAAFSPDGSAEVAAARAAASHRRRWAGVVAGAVLVAAAVWFSRSAHAPESGGPPPTPPPTPGALDLSGRWHAQISKMVGGSSPRPVLREISIESGPDGGILAARVVFTDPGRGGAGAGYRNAPDGARRLAEATAALAADPKGAALSIDFLELPGWMAKRPRLWKALEGAGHSAEPAHYVLVESLETDNLVQAGINESGFLSYAFFSGPDVLRRGEDVLSRVIHPEPHASLRGFRSLVWDLTGAADFLTMELPVTISGPQGGAPDSVTLKR